VAVDVRFSHTELMLSDFGGHLLTLEILETPSSPSRLIRMLAFQVRKLLKLYQSTSSCEGIGMAVPGIVEHQTGRIVHAPTLGWHGIDIRDKLAAATGLPVHVENAAKACALAQMWHGRSDAARLNNFVHVSVSDGVGVGIVINGELVRGQDNLAGEFGHIPLNIDGPLCMCGSRGCWEVYTSNIATLSRYLHKGSSNHEVKSKLASARSAPTITDVVASALNHDSQAIEAIQTTARYLGLGLATIIHSINPACVYVGGEITAAWDLIGATVLSALKERALTASVENTPIRIAAMVDYPRLRGATALVTAPTFAAPRVA
jgi:N-acetylglucosamine repressor